MTQDPSDPQGKPKPPLSVAELRQAAKNSNTAAAYKSAVRHFQFVWGGRLPATPETICEYLADFQEKLSVRTLEVRLAGLAKWHVMQMVADPTKHESVKQTMKGIRMHYLREPKKATPLSLSVIRQIVGVLDADAKAALVEIENHQGDQAATTYRDARKRQLRAVRDKAMLLLGFWRAFRSDELSRLEAQHITAVKGQDISIFLPFSKTDRSANGKTYHMVALRELCPVSAYVDWIEESGIQQGPVFRKIHHWGKVGTTGIASKSIGPILVEMCTHAGVDPQSISTHSMRHGFANWAIDAGWGLPTLMKFVGWASYRNAVGYVRERPNFGALGLDQPGQSERVHHDKSSPGETISALPLPGAGTKTY